MIDLPAFKIFFSFKIPSLVKGCVGRLHNQPEINWQNWGEEYKYAHTNAISRMLQIKQSCGNWYSKNRHQHNDQHLNNKIWDHQWLPLCLSSNYQKDAWTSKDDNQTLEYKRLNLNQFYGSKPSWTQMLNTKDLTNSPWDYDKVLKLTS